MAMTESVHTRFPTDVMQELERVTKIMDKTKSNVICSAVKKYVREILEDYEDGMEAMRILNDPNTKWYSSEEATEYLRAKRQEQHV